MKEIKKKNESKYQPRPWREKDRESSVSPLFLSFSPLWRKERKKGEKMKTSVKGPASEITNERTNERLVPSEVKPWLSRNGWFSCSFRDSICTRSQSVSQTLGERWANVGRVKPNPTNGVRVYSGSRFALSQSNVGRHWSIDRFDALKCFLSVMMKGWISRFFLFRFLRLFDWSRCQSFFHSTLHSSSSLFFSLFHFIFIFYFILILLFNSILFNYLIHSFPLFFFHSIQFNSK